MPHLNVTSSPIAAESVTVIWKAVGPTLPSYCETSATDTVGRPPLAVSTSKSCTSPRSPTTLSPAGTPSMKKRTSSPGRAVFGDRGSTESIGMRSA